MRSARRTLKVLVSIVVVPVTLGFLRNVRNHVWKKLDFPYLVTEPDTPALGWEVESMIVEIVSGQRRVA